MKNQKKRNLIFIGFLAFFYALYTFVISPLYTLACSDVIYMETYLPDVLEFAKELLDLLIWAWIFAFTLASEKDTGRSVFRYAAVPIADFVRYIAVLLISSYFAGGDEAIAFYVTDALISFALDMLHFVLCLLIGHLLLSRLNADRKREVFSCDAEFTLKNPLTLAALLSSSVVSLVRIGMRVRYDVFYGAPESASDLMWMVLYYTSDLIYGFLVFLVTLLILNKINSNKNSRS